MINFSFYLIVLNIIWKNLKTHRKDSILEPIVVKEKKKYIPAWNHPWKKAFYENYLKYFRPNQQNNYAYNYE